MSTRPGALRIVADRVIAEAGEAFAEFGEVTLLDGRAIHQALLADADVLLVRSVTRVDAALLAGTPVRFVGTATAGTDHLDEEFLRSQGIHYVAAPGCNSRAVGEYVLACVLAFAAVSGREPESLRCGVVGCGHAGSQVVALLEAIGVHCLRNDPPLAAAGAGFVPLTAALSADIVSLHVPLTEIGAWRTRALIGAAELAQLAPGGLLINAARGGIVDELAWREAAAAGKLKMAVDCWVDEPRISHATLNRAWIATPHIAGHTVDARLRATAQLRQSLAGWRGIDAREWRPADLDARQPLTLMPAANSSAQIRQAVFACCDPLELSAVLRDRWQEGADHRAVFDQLRAEFGRRREFTRQAVALKEAAADTAAILQKLGFKPVQS